MSLRRASVTLLLLSPCGMLAFGQANSASTPASDAIQPAVSQVRIVRLSQVQGEARIDRHLGAGFESTFANLPIVQGTQLATQHGLAEVEFEDNSSLRLGPRSWVDFTQLGRTAAGDTVNRIKLIKGTLYVSHTRDKQSDLQVAVGERTMMIPAGTHLRLDVYPAGSELVVFKGKVQVIENDQSLTVGTGKALKFGGPDDAPPLLVRDEVPGLYDQWDQNSVEYHTARVASAYAGSPYAYGSQDLNQYGSFVDAGCGSMWQPYFTSAAWDPFATGVWTYYPGAGYSWVSPYPWGWTPYHSGSWISCGGQGWGWKPSGSWAGLQNPVLFHKVNGPKLPHPGATRPMSMVGVGMNQLRASHTDAQHQFQFAKNSAGLGVPREMPIKLGKVSSQVAQHGTAQMYLPTVNPITAHTIAVLSAGTQQGSAAHVGPIAGGAMSRPVSPVGAAGAVSRGGGSYASAVSSLSPGGHTSAGSTSSNGSSSAAMTAGGPVTGGASMGGAASAGAAGSSGAAHH